MVKGCGFSGSHHKYLILSGSSQDCGPNDEHILDGITSLHTASVEGSLELVQLLLDDRADVEDRGAVYQTALMGGNLEVAPSLIKYGADMNSTSGIGETPLHAASRFGHLDIVHLLLDSPTMTLM